VPLVVRLVRSCLYNSRFSSLLQYAQERGEVAMVEVQQWTWKNNPKCTNAGMEVQARRCWRSEIASATESEEGERVTLTFNQF